VLPAECVLELLVLAEGGLPGCAPSLAGALEVLVVLLDALLNLTFFSTKPLSVALELALLAGLALGEALLAPAARCRQPVAIVMLVVVVADAWVSGVAGVCAAIDPHSATAVPSVTVHSHRCPFFMFPSPCASRAIDRERREFP
jgi:hypothetical protein